MPDAWAWPDWAYASNDGTFGNRWDEPLGSYRVLYACSQRVGAFVETLARFRPDLEVVAALAEIDAATIRRSAPRGFTQDASRVAYEWRDEDGSLAGIRYGSRLGDDFVNWAIFEPAPEAESPFLDASSSAFDADDHDLAAALGLLGLQLG